MFVRKIGTKVGLCSLNLIRLLVNNLEAQI
jgi:hypothetical protein